MESGGVKVNGKVERFASVKVKEKDLIAYGGLSEKEEKAMDLSEERILYEDDFVLAWNKEPGFPCQRTRDANRSNVEDELNRNFQNRGRLVLAHRLDRDTSGVLLFGKGRENADLLSSAFRERKIFKTYLALSLKSASTGMKGDWKHYLQKAGERGGRAWYAPAARGKSAFTTYEVLASGAGASLWMLHPKTGRTHQIRAQMSYAGYPVAGDDLYDPVHALDSLPHHLLHAARIQIPQKNLIIVASLPTLFEKELMKNNFNIPRGL